MESFEKYTIIEKNDFAIAYIKHSLNTVSSRYKCGYTEWGRERERERAKGR